MQEFDPSIGSKALAFEYFKSVVERGGVDIPYYPQNLLAEMRTFEFEHVASGMKLHAPQGMSDDFVHSACYAILGLKEPEAAQTGMANAWPTSPPMSPSVAAAMVSRSGRSGSSHVSRNPRSAMIVATRKTVPSEMVNACA